MTFKFLRTAFGLGGPAATRQTGYIARSLYVIGAAAALVWLLFIYYAFIAQQSLLFFLTGAVVLPVLWLGGWVLQRGITAKLTDGFPKEPRPWYEPFVTGFRKWFAKQSLFDKLATVFLGVLFIPGALLLAFLVLYGLFFSKEFGPIQLAGISFAVAFFLATLPGALYVAGEALKEWDWYRDRFILPRGPATRWGGILSFIQHDIGDFFPRNAEEIACQEHSTIYLGKTFAEQDPRLGCRQVGLRSQQHMMTVALTGAGKSRDAIWNTLLSWSGGAFVFDPKGEHVQCTFARRAAYRPAYALDPYRMAPHITKTAHYNPLDEIDPDSPSAGADIVNVVEASLYIEKTEGANTAHFRENAQTVLKGFIAHVLTRYPQHRRNLPAVADLLATGAVEDSGEEDAYDIGVIKKVLEEMRNNRAIAKAPMWAMKILDDVSPKEAGGYLSTIYRGIRWVNDPPVRRTLLWSDFRLGDLKSKEISVYMVLPRSRIAEQIRWVRTLTTLAMFRCERTAQPDGSKRKVLMLLDEFPQLGTFKPIKDGLVAVRSANIKLWVIFQNIGALTELYDNAHAFYSSCDQQYFGVSATDDATNEHVSKALGRYLKEHKEGRAGETHHQENIRDLLSPGAVAQFLRSEGHNQIVFPAGKSLPLKLTRVPFHKNCTSGTYGQVKDLGETLTQEHIDAELEQLREQGRAHTKQEAQAQPNKADHANPESIAAERRVEEGFIQHIKKRIRTDLRLRAEKPMIKETEELLRVVQDDLWSCIKARDFGDAASRKLAEYERALQPGYVMGQFKDVVENAHVKAVLDKFPDAMAPEYFRLHHAGDVNRIFGRAARLLPLEEIMDMADYIASNDVLRRSAAIDSGYCYARDDIFFGMGELVRRCPVENKLELYAKLEASGYLKDRMPKRKSDDVVFFVADAFEGIDTDTAVTVLRSSEAWKAVKKDKLLRDWIIHRDKRLLPVLEEEWTSEQEPAAEKAGAAQTEPAQEKADTGQAASRLEPEEAGEAIRSEAQRAERKRTRRYTPEQETAREHWSLAIGYTEAQVHGRAPFMYRKAAANDVEQVTAEYDLLLEAAA